MERIAIVGICGGGKSSLARRLGDALDLPVIHLDQHHHLPGFRAPDPDVWTKRLHQLESGERWVIDGNYTSNSVARFDRAELIVYMTLPTRVALWRVWSRAVRTRGKQRADAAPGCVERPLSPGFWSFLWWVATWNRRQRPKLEQLLDTLPPERRVTVRSWEDADRLVAQFAAVR